jgi:hypothetical protein
MQSCRDFGRAALGHDFIAVRHCLLSIARCCTLGPVSLLMDETKLLTDGLVGKNFGTLQMSVIARDVYSLCNDTICKRARKV